MIDVSCLPIRDERSVRAHTSRRNRGRDDQPKEVAMTDREVEAVSDFLRHFGSFGCRQICIRPGPARVGYQPGFARKSLKLHK